MHAGHSLTDHMIPIATSHALALAHRHRGSVPGTRRLEHELRSQHRFDASTAPLRRP
jgi:hypothetical protein